MAAASLQEFITVIKNDVDRFEQEWLEKHLENPEQYPLELPKDNAGLWYEFLITFIINDEL
jgi:hypothetical protein